MKRLLNPPTLLVLLGLSALAATGALLLDRSPEPVRATIAVSEALAGDTAGYRRVMGPRPFSFPADHGPHPEYKTEWWYYTGNLQATTGEHFGYQLTFFRTAISPIDTVSRGSAWASRQIYMAHFALTDVAGREFHANERFSRGAAGLAGAASDSFRVWLEDWEATGQGAEALPMRLHAVTDEVSLNLVLESGKPAVLQGDRGYDRKGAGPGDASHYYSLTRMPSAGEIRVRGRTFKVRGSSWMDREWSTSALAKNQLGWDWFALQLSDGRDLMFYQIREAGGGTSPFSDGVLVSAEGAARPLAKADVRIEVLDTWKSPVTGARYPNRWRLTVPREQLILEITPFLADQELNVTVTYWEGAVRMRGTANGRPVTGYGYIEMTGYGPLPGGRSDNAPAVAR